MRALVCAEGGESAALQQVPSTVAGASAAERGYEAVNRKEWMVAAYIGISIVIFVVLVAQGILWIWNHLCR